MGDHLCTCTDHSGVKTPHDWVVDQLAYLFRITHTVKTQHVTKNRGRYCGEIELEVYLVNVVGPVSLVLDLLIVHDRFGSSSDLNLNGHLHYPNDIDRSLNETATDKIRKYRADYNNNPPNDTSFIPAIASMSRRLHSEFVRLLFLHSHRKTDRFFADSGFQIAHSTSGLFHFRRETVPTRLKGMVGKILVKDATLRVNLKP
jgi:hypothetical protein